MAAFMPLQVLREHAVREASPVVASSVSDRFAESDEALLDDVDREVSAALPTTMQALADPTGDAASASVQEPVPAKVRHADDRRCLGDQTGAAHREFVVPPLGNRLVGEPISAPIMQDDIGPVLLIVLRSAGPKYFDRQVGSLCKEALKTAGKPQLDEAGVGTNAKARRRTAFMPVFCHPKGDRELIETLTRG